MDNVKILMRHGAKKSIDVPCRGYTPLMLSIDDKNLLKFLVENGADKTIKNRRGETAYDTAKRQNVTPTKLKMLRPATTKKSSKSRSSKYSVLEQLTLKDDALKWERKTSSNHHKQVTAQGAKEHCEKLKWADFDDYRLPTLKEMKTIALDKPITDFYIAGIGNYYIDPKRFPNVVPTSHWVKLKSREFGYFSFATKRSGKVCPSCEKNFVRCVRGD